MTLSEAWVLSAAPSAETAKKARALVGGVHDAHISRDGNLLFAECRGSDTKEYAVSADFLPPSPVYRCSCPSRQSPCKHAVALMLSYAADAGGFTLADEPAYATNRREKLRGHETPKPRKTNMARAAKKAALQAMGLKTAMDIAEALIGGGLGAVTQKRVYELRERCRYLAGCYLPGICAELLAILQNHAAAYDTLPEFYAQCTKARAYFLEKAENPLVINAELETYCGFAWRLSELKQLGFYSENARLMQYYFEVRDNEASREIEETGYWFELNTGEMFITQNKRPYRALRYTREESPCHGVVSVPCLYRYPLRSRVRWESYTLSQPAAADYALLLSRAGDTVDTSGDVAYLRIGALSESEDGNVWLTCGDGRLIRLASAAFARKEHTALFAKLIPDAENRIMALPLAYVCESGITRAATTRKA
ncbi:MAG: SWIM zinc finger family protein [Oscillospiraceae bacterium]|jgi:hypothetical protein|nr:SWIM zinc finger family protein [Oscillospiraceae bacterium]